MFKSVRTGKFKKEFSLAEKRGKDMDKLIEIMRMIICEEPLPPQCRNHLLHGKWEKTFECHVEPDWLLIYEIDKSIGEVIFHRTGTHADLF